jgi:hypothetical protein
VLDTSENDPGKLRAELRRQRELSRRLQERLDKTFGENEDNEDKAWDRWEGAVQPWADAVARERTDGDRIESLARLIHNDTRPGCVELALWLYELADKLGRSSK